MNTLIRIASPEDITAPVGFDTPLDMLRACHRRVEQQFSTLRRLSSHLAMSGSDKQAQEAATAVMRYFDIAAPKHH
ncbi:MAG: hemerythrin domain-containing protein, partial [Rubrivivax sp.]